MQDRLLENCTWVVKCSTWCMLSLNRDAVTPTCVNHYTLSLPRVPSLVPRPHPKIGERAWSHLQTISYALSQHIM